MPSFIVSILVGIICIVLGILNTKGNISSLHSYHRARVKEEDKLPFGKLVGTGMIIIGSSLNVFGALSLVTELTSKLLYILIGTVFLTVGLVVGLVITFYAMKKYNKGIF